MPHATPVPCTCYTRVMHMLHLCSYTSTPAPCTCHTFRPPYIWGSYAVRVTGLLIDECHGSHWTPLGSGVVFRARKPLRRVSAQILTFTHPRSQNVYERIDTPLAALLPCPALSLRCRSMFWLHFAEPIPVSSRIYSPDNISCLRNVLYVFCTTFRLKDEHNLGSIDIRSRQRTQYEHFCCFPYGSRS